MNTHPYIFKYTCIYINIYYGSCPLDSIMTFTFYNSSMDTEVAPQPQPRSTEFWTVGALEVSCDHCRGCSAVSLSDSSKFLALSLFKVDSSSVNRASPFWFAHGISLQVSRTDVAPLAIGFDCLYTAVLVYLGFFCRPGVPHTSGISASDTHPFESHVQPTKVGPWWWWPLCWWT